MVIFKEARTKILSGPWGWPMYTTKKYQSLFLIFFGLFFLETTWAQRNEIVICQEHLQAIGNALRVYLTKTTHYPEELRDLQHHGLLPREYLACPAERHFFGVIQHSYTYRQPILQKVQELHLLEKYPESASSIVVVSDKKNIHEVNQLALGNEWFPLGRNVLLLSGEVIYLEKLYIEKLFEKQSSWMEKLYLHGDVEANTKEFLAFSKQLIEEGTQRIIEGKELRKSKVEKIKLRFFLICLSFGVVVFLFALIRGRSKSQQYELKPAENATICILLLLIFGSILFYLTLMGEHLTPEEFFIINIIACPALGFSFAVLSQHGILSKIFGLLTTICYLSLILFILLNSFFATLLES